MQVSLTNQHLEAFSGLGGGGEGKGEKAQSLSFGAEDPAGRRGEAVGVEFTVCG